MVLAACVPTVQRAGSPLDGFTGPRFEPAAERFISFDGAELGLTAWLPPNNAEPRAVIIGLHGMNDYANTFYLAGPWFAARGVAVFAYDARGFGRSPRRGVWAGERLMTEDLRTAVMVARHTYPNAEIVVVGDSMGSAEAIATFGAPNAPSVDRLVLVAPAVWGWSTLPDQYALALWVGAHTFPWRAVQPPRGVVRRVTASDNREALLQAGRAPHMIWSTRIDAVYGLVGLMDDALLNAPKVGAPLLVLYGQRDEIVPRWPIQKLVEKLKTPPRIALYPNGYHLLMRDLSREIVWTDVLAFIGDRTAPLPSGYEFARQAFIEGKVWSDMARKTAQHGSAPARN